MIKLILFIALIYISVKFFGSHTVTIPDATKNKLENVKKYLPEVRLKDENWWNNLNN